MGIWSILRIAAGIGFGAVAIIALVFAVMYFLRRGYARMEYAKLEEKAREVYNFQEYTRLKGISTLLVAVAFTIFSVDFLSGIDTLGLAMLPFIFSIIIDGNLANAKKYDAHEKALWKGTVILLASLFALAMFFMGVAMLIEWWGRGL